MGWLEGREGCKDVPCGTKTFLGFPCAAGCGVGDLAHAGNVGFGGCEIASRRPGEIVSIDSLAFVRGGQEGEDVHTRRCFLVLYQPWCCYFVLYGIIMIAMRLYKAGDGVFLVEI